MFSCTVIYMYEAVCNGMYEGVSLSFSVVFFSVLFLVKILKKQKHWGLALVFQNVTNVEKR